MSLAKICKHQEKHPYFADLNFTKIIWQIVFVSYEILLVDYIRLIPTESWDLCNSDNISMNVCWIWTESYTSLFHFTEIWECKDYFSWSNLVWPFLLADFHMFYMVEKLWIKLIHGSNLKYVCHVRFYGFILHVRNK